MTLDDESVDITENVLREAGSVLTTLSGGGGNGNDLVYSLGTWITENGAYYAYQQDWFTIDSATGAISFRYATSFDYETYRPLKFDVSVSDGSVSTTAEVTINVTNVNEAPKYTGFVAYGWEGSGWHFTMLYSDGDRTGGYTDVASAGITAPDGTDLGTISNDNGEYDAVVHIVSVGNERIDIPTKVSIGNIPSSLVMSAPSVVNAGSSFDLSVTGKKVGNDMISSITIDWGDGSTGTASANTSRQALPHTYAVAGTYTITGTITDEDGSWTTEMDLVVGQLPGLPTTPAVPDILYGDVTILDQTTGRALVVLETLDGSGGEPVNYEWDLDGDGVYEYSSGDVPSVEVYPDTTPGLVIPYLLDVRVTDADGNVGYARLGFAGAGRTPKKANLNTYRARFEDAAGVKLRSDFQVHHLVGVGRIKTSTGEIDYWAQRVMKEKGIDLHSMDNLRAMPKEKHELLNSEQQAWFRQKARECGIPYDKNRMQEIYDRIKVDEYLAMSQSLNAPYRQYFLTAASYAEGLNTVLQLIAQPGEKAAFQLQKANRLKTLGLTALSSVGIFTLISSQSVVAANIAKHGQDQTATFDFFVKKYDEAIDEVIDQGYLSRATAEQFVDSFMEYMRALGIKSDVASSLHTLLITHINVNYPN